MIWYLIGIGVLGTAAMMWSEHTRWRHAEAEVVRQLEDAGLETIEIRQTRFGENPFNDPLIKPAGVTVRVGNVYRGGERTYRMLVRAPAGFEQVIWAQVRRSAIGGHQTVKWLPTPAAVRGSAEPIAT